MLDSFDTPAVRTPTSVPRVQITLTVFDGDPNTYAASYSFPIADQSGEYIETREGNLVPHLTAQQITQAKAFMDAMLAKAQGVIQQ